METKVRFFDYPKQFKAKQEAYMRIVRETFSKGSYILGSEVDAFEREFAALTGARNAVAVGNCTDGLLLCLYALGVGSGDEIITVSHTFVATVEVIVALGATPVFVDIADDHNMDVDKVEGALSQNTKAIIPVQLNGRICSNMDKLVELAAERGVSIIEDAAQSVGAKFKGKCAGTFGIAGCFSFYPAKLLGTFGDAGAIVTDKDDLADKLRMIRNHGRSTHGEVVLWGMNSRMDSVHAAILSYKLGFVKETIKRRREIAGLYHRGLSGISHLKLPPPPVENDDHYDVFQNYEIEAENRDELRRYCEENGVETALPWGGKGVHQFEALGIKSVELPRTEQLFEKALMLPLYPELTDEQVEYVVEVVSQFYS
ncbi:MAG: DegT/DnrJ/EryC1/StrS family aminotransferase [Actinobacteria bacterium]|nr:DegT/DnrJ/EryC1/StrS family aminotransferase [Actinomycetota bacterium]